MLPHEERKCMYEKMCEKVWLIQWKLLYLPRTLKHTDMIEVKRKGTKIEIDREQLAAELFMYRHKAQLTQQELADMWQVSRYSIMRAEKGDYISMGLLFTIYANLTEALRKEASK